MTAFSNEVAIPPTAETLRGAALAAAAERARAAAARRLAEAEAELPRRATEYLGGLVVSPEMLAGEELHVDGLRFRLAVSGCLSVLLPCPGSADLCEYEFSDLAGLGDLLG